MIRLDSSLFDWSTWRASNIEEEFKVPLRNRNIEILKEQLKKYAIGWCPSEQLPCRPKIGYIAVMFQVEDRVFWTHFTYNEFIRIWSCA